MFSKTEEIDEIELGAELYLEGLKESRKALATQNTITETPQEPASVYKERKIVKSFVSSKVEFRNSERILERAKELLAV